MSRAATDSRIVAPQPDAVAETSANDRPPRQPVALAEAVSSATDFGVVRRLGAPATEGASLAAEPSRRRRARLTIAGLVMALALVSIAAAGIGAVAISPGMIFAILGKRLGFVDAAVVDPTLEAILLAIRLPRVALGLLVGAALGSCGVLLQGLFRNPLADPTLLGISSGAAFAAAVGMVLGGSLEPLTNLLGNALIPILSFAGALIAMVIVQRIASSGKRTEVATLLLAGIAFTALAEAGTGLLSHLATEAQLRSIVSWRLGSLGGATWTTTAWVAAPMGLLFLSLRRLSRPLDALLLGEREAAHLGVSVEGLKRWIVVLAALAVGAAVAASGVIGFVGLVVPHLIRMAIGPGHRYLLPASALGGALLLLGADLVARTATAPAELPIGVVTSAVGAPFFVFLLLRYKKGMR